MWIAEEGVELNRAKVSAFRQDSNEILPAIPMFPGSSFSTGIISDTFRSNWMVPGWWPSNRNYNVQTVFFYLSCYRKDRNEIQMATSKCLRSGFSQFSMVLFPLLPGLTWSGKSKMVAAKLNLHKTQRIDYRYRHNSNDYTHVFGIQKYDETYDNTARYRTSLLGHRGLMTMPIILNQFSC